MEKDRSILKSNFVYSLDKIVKTDFNKNLDTVCTEGIQYFKTKEAALSWFYGQVGENFPDGKWTTWYENGQKRYEGIYKDDEYDGKWIWWYENGNKETEGTYKDGIQDGKWTQWWNDGSEVYEGIYQRYF